MPLTEKVFPKCVLARVNRSAGIHYNRPKQSVASSCCGFECGSVSSAPRTVSNASTAGGCVKPVQKTLEKCSIWQVRWSKMNNLQIIISKRLSAPNQNVIYPLGGTRFGVPNWNAGPRNVPATLFLPFRRDPVKIRN